MSATQDAPPLIDAATEAGLLALVETEPRSPASTARGRTASRLLWDERRVIAKIVSCGTTLSLLIAFFIPDTFESKARLMPSPILRARMIIGGIPANIGADPFTFASAAMFVRLMKSDVIRDALIDRYDLRRVYGNNTYRSARKRLERNTRLVDDWRTGTVDITVSDRDPQRASAIAASYVENLNRLLEGLSTSGAHRERLFLEGRLKTAKKDLDESARAFSKFASENTAIDIEAQEQALIDATTAIQGRAIAAESELRALEQTYTPDNVRVRATQARLAELHRQLTRLKGGLQNDDSPPFTGLLYPSLRQLPRLGSPYADLYRNLKINETVYEVLTQEYEVTRLQEAREVPGLVVVDAPVPAEKRSGPSRLLIVLGSVFLSLSIGATWAWAREAWNCSDRDNRWRGFIEEIAATIVNRVRDVYGL